MYASHSALKEMSGSLTDTTSVLSQNSALGLAPLEAATTLAVPETPKRFFDVAMVARSSRFGFFSEQADTNHLAARVILMRVWLANQRSTKRQHSQYRRVQREAKKKTLHNKPAFPLSAHFQTRLSTAHNLKHTRLYELLHEMFA
jgi:hypothetical protein